jgi:hypothetical protein
MLDDKPFAGLKIVHYLSLLDILKRQNYDSDQIIDIGLCRLNLIESAIQVRTSASDIVPN